MVNVALLTAASKLLSDDSLRLRFMQMRGRLANSVVAQRTKALFEDRQKVFFYGGAFVSPLLVLSGLLIVCRS